MGMLLWKVGVFKRPRVPQGPPGNWPAVGHWWQCWLLYMGSRPMAEFCVRPVPFFAIWVEHGVVFCLLNFIPFEHLRVFVPLPLPE